MRVVAVRFTVRLLPLVSVTVSMLPFIWLTVPLTVWRTCPPPDAPDAPGVPPPLPPNAPGVPVLRKV